MSVRRARTGGEERRILSYPYRKVEEREGRML
jgi:hypothetical protein